MRPYPFTAATYEKWPKEGRGTGSPENWNPWLHRGDFNSNGIASVDHHGRPVHLFSNVERFAWLCYRFKRNVSGLIEQVPIPRDASRAEARVMGITHPRSEAGEDIVMTTDLVFVETLPDGRRVEHARSVKVERDYSNHNQMEHAELERRMQLRMGRTFHFISEKSFTETLMHNIDQLYMHRDAHLTEPLGYQGSFEYLATEVAGEILASKTQDKLFRFCSTLNEKRGWPPGVATSVAINLSGRHELRIDYSGMRLENQTVASIAEATRLRRENEQQGRAA